MSQEMQLKNVLQSDEAYNPTQEAEPSSGEEDTTPAPLCTATLRRGLGTYCRARSIPFDGYNINRCGRHRICHGQSIKSGDKCQKYVYKGNILCASCQTQAKDEVRVLTVESEEEVVQMMDYTGGTHSATKTHAGKKEAKAAMPVKAVSPQNIEQPKSIKQAPPSVSHSLPSPAPTTTVAGARRSGRLNTGKAVTKAAAKLGSKGESQPQTPYARIEVSSSDLILAGAGPAMVPSMNCTSSDKTSFPATHSRVTVSEAPPAVTKPARKSKGKSQYKASSVPPEVVGIGSSAAAQDASKNQAKAKAQGKRSLQPKPTPKPNAATKEEKKKKAAQGGPATEAAKQASNQIILAKIAELQRLLEVDDNGVSLGGVEGRVKEEEENQEEVGDAKALMSGALTFGDPDQGLKDWEDDLVNGTADDLEDPAVEDDNKTECKEDKENGESGREEDELSALLASSLRS